MKESLRKGRATPKESQSQEPGAGSQQSGGAREPGQAGVGSQEPKAEGRARAGHQARRKQGSFDLSQVPISKGLVRRNLNVPVTRCACMQPSMCQFLCLCVSFMQRINVSSHPLYTNDCIHTCIDVPMDMRCSNYVDAPCPGWSHPVDVSIYVMSHARVVLNTENGGAPTESQTMVQTEVGQCGKKNLPYLPQSLPLPHRAPQPIPPPEQSMISDLTCLTRPPGKDIPKL